MLYDYLNVSDHLPVLDRVEVDKTILNEEYKLIDIKPKWDKFILIKYKDTINRFLGLFPGDVETEFDFGAYDLSAEKSNSREYTRA